MLTTDEVYAAFYDDDAARGFLHSHSYTGNPLACRAAVATLELFEQVGPAGCQSAAGPEISAAFAVAECSPPCQQTRASRE